MDHNSVKSDLSKIVLQVVPYYIVQLTLVLFPLVQFLATYMNVKVGEFLQVEYTRAVQLVRILRNTIFFPLCWIPWQLRGNTSVMSVTATVTGKKVYVVQFFGPQSTTPLSGSDYRETSRISN